MKKILLSIALVFLICTQAWAESSVWKIQKDNSVMYLGGTFHLLRPSDFPLPPEFAEAYRASDLLVFETDLGKLNEPSVQEKLLAKAVYADGSTIDQHVSGKTYRLLNEYCAVRGIPLENLKHFKPSIIAVTLASVELAKFGVAKEGVDSFFHKLATEEKKRIEGLETIDQQIQYVVEMGAGNEDAYIAHTLRDLKSIKQDYETMVEAWRKGDLKKIDALFVAELKKTMPKLYKKLLTDRNKLWFPLLEAYHRTPEKEFILVGAGHLAGTEGIIETLRRKGYTVEKLL
ncbi:TraB/GumN family protein [Thiovibrio frasassiensis]|uniref:TraB/GumN family protein n=1 Tax=Thiovibrio frasassiensis TaxID=2984131 RepID=A0A9X4MI18_9BACT|nr:TraB/GumN family protein [Thiovibrio frasassiensis]MDG4476733.1 TraB/GumN family protein [Thiovibrio frasassiensis]